MLPTSTVQPCNFCLYSATPSRKIHQGKGAQGPAENECIQKFYGFIEIWGARESRIKKDTLRSESVKGVAEIEKEEEKIVEEK